VGARTQLNPAKARQEWLDADRFARTICLCVLPACWHLARPVAERDWKRLKRAITEGGLGSAIFSKRAWDNVADVLGLSRRELEILRGMFDGLTESTIAARLHISLRTAHTHMERLHRKLHVTHQVELVLRLTVEFLKLAGVPGSGVPPICAQRSPGCCRTRP
jgi:DNA-binding CsgD family transcriptional regulator